jgi:hypothetical protein
MLIALLALLGVDLIVIVALVAFVLLRKRWVKRQPGAFKGAIRVTIGQVEGLGSKWKRGYGRWVRDILVWTKGPLLLRNEVLAVDELEDRRPAETDEVKHLGDRPVVIRVAIGGATVEIASGGDQAESLLGPYRVPADPPAAAADASMGGGL